MLACNGGTSSSADGEVADTMAPREATDPVPNPPTLPDTLADKPNTTEQLDREQQVLYRLTGTEPFWSLRIGRPYSTFLSMEGDSINFAYQEPRTAAGRQEEWAQLFPLGQNNWVLLRKGLTPCSDGMSDRKYTYTATLSIKGKLLDGCGEKQ